MMKMIKINSEMTKKFRLKSDNKTKFLREKKYPAW